MPAAVPWIARARRAFAHAPRIALIALPGLDLACAPRDAIDHDARTSIADADGDGGDAASGECGALRTRCGKLAVRASMVTRFFHRIRIFVSRLRGLTLGDSAAFVPCAE